MKLFAAAAIILSAVISCHGAHRWLHYRYPWIDLPRDMGAWTGLAIGLASAYWTLY